MDAVTFSVFREGFKAGFGADGDHLKTPEEIVYALDNGFTMITLDLSEHIRQDGGAEKLELTEELKNRYLNRVFTVEGEKIVYDEEQLKKCYYIYGEALNLL